MPYSKWVPLSRMFLLLIIVILTGNVCTDDFSPNVADYDAYGLKIAGNDIMLVEAQGDYPMFLVQFAPYDYKFDSLQCYIYYDDPTHYVYSVGIGAKQNSNQAYFFFAGEVAGSTTDQSGNNGTFIGIWRNNDSISAQTYAANNQSLNCDSFQVKHLQFISSYDHQDFFVFVVDPYGQYAIGLAKDFVFIYRPFSSSSVMTTTNSSVVWPNNTTFTPRAADCGISYTIVAGFVENDLSSRVRATPTVYVMSNSNLTVLATWNYTATADSWESRLTYAGFDSWSKNFIMSVDINPEDPTRVLVGIPYLNTVFSFVVGNYGATLTLHSFVTNGESVGFGKSVAWLSTSQAAILVSTFSLDYTTWYSSQIYLYLSLNSTVLPSSPTAVFPNTQQPMPTTISAQLIRIISTPTSLAVLDVSGGLLLILSESPGFYASTGTTNSSVVASMPVVSYSATCMAGTYKADTGIHPCSLCPTGSRNPGNIVAASCINCSSDVFCPLGAIIGIERTLLLTRSQAYPYPRSPESTIFDEILIHNMFSIGSTSHCIIVSPLFWVFIIMVLILVVLASIGVLKWCIQHPKGHQLHAFFKRVFRQTDLVGEGEMWVGGLVSFAIVVLAISAYSFSSGYLRQYPAESVGPSTFACDQTIRNAKYESSLQSLAIPVSDEEQPMFDLLDQQNLTLHLDLLNTLASCEALSIQQILGSSAAYLTISTCTYSKGTLSATVNLPYRGVTIQWILAGIQLVGAVRLGLSGDEHENGLFKLKELDFSQTFYSNSDGTLAQTASISLQLTKAINETEPMSGDESEFSGVWYPTFVVDKNQMFISAEKYVTSANLTSTTLIIVISETPYFVQNRQLPIAKQPEIIFQNLLFTIVCLEIFGLIFLLFKLAIIPVLDLIVKCWQKTNCVQPALNEIVHRNEEANHLDNDIELTHTNN